MRIGLEASGLAVALANALAFHPARNVIPYVGLKFTRNAVYTLGSNGDYVIGTDEAHEVSFKSIAEQAEIDSKPMGQPHLSLLSKEGATALERAAREAKKATCVLASDGSTVELTAFGIEPVVTEDHSASEDGPKWVEHFEQTWDLLAEVEKRDHVLPGGILLDFTVASGFSKVKADKAERVANFLFGEAYDPVFIKIGKTFKGIWVPVEPVVHSELVGTEGLW